MRHHKRHFTYKDLFLALSASFLVCAIVIPNFINYLYQPKNNISSLIKENVAIAGKNYFSEEKDKDSVVLEELIRKGYITDTKPLINNDCDIKLSSVDIQKVSTNKYNYVVDLYCGDYFSVLTLSS